ncbi:MULTISPECIES: hypothetical protein [Streptomyces]|uniref:Uncharacterized protein n=1 Tax=Streptomyces silvisoli TaxID=3034235 RepID=A0ABT5ZLX1_9ACTN|nr:MULTISPECIES: hypothetical protein [Streptomyces]MDF3290820.1 hypothetical protein [Streptomyces silvisoli]
MADYQNPNQNPDPAGSTQMFRAFVDEGVDQRPAAGAGTTYGRARGGSRTGVVVGVVVAVLVIAAVAYFALG